MLEPVSQLDCNTDFEDMTEKNKFIKLLDKIVARPKPSAPRAGFKASGSRYEKGGKVSRKKSV